VAEHRDEVDEHAATEQQQATGVDEHAATDEERATEMAPDSDDPGAEFATAAAAAAAAGQETEQRYARPDADRLSDEMLAEIARRSTGAGEAAFFDLDKTIIAKSSTLVMGRTFYRDGLISSSMVLKTLYAQVVYQLAGADHERMEQARHAALELTRGWDADRIRHLVRETMEETIAPLAYQEALDLIVSHRRAGRDVWIVSSGGEEIVEPYSEFIGVKEVIATRSGIDADGRYDGTLEFYAYAGAKANAIRQIAEVRGYDLTRCFAYTDSITDLPMLSAVGHPTAVNPDKELRAAAEAMDWQIRVFASPVRLRDRLPEVQPAGQVAAGLIGAAAAGLLVWRYLTRD